MRSCTLHDEDYGAHRDGATAEGGRPIAHLALVEEPERVGFHCPAQFCKKAKGDLESGE